jgi:hypothetical protein
MSSACTRHPHVCLVSVTWVSQWRSGFVGGWVQNTAGWEGATLVIYKSTLQRPRRLRGFYSCESQR